MYDKKNVSLFSLQKLTKNSRKMLTLQAYIFTKNSTLKRRIISLKRERYEKTDTSIKDLTNILSLKVKKLNLNAKNKWPQLLNTVSNILDTGTTKVFSKGGF